MVSIRNKALQRLRDQVHGLADDDNSATLIWLHGNFEDISLEGIFSFDSLRKVVDAYDEYLMAEQRERGKSGVNIDKTGSGRVHSGAGNSVSE